MNTRDLDYDLPEALIAQHPRDKRDASRLMVLDRDSGDVRLDVYENVAQYLRAGDCMVLNNTRVIRARLYGRKPTGGRVEAFLLHENGPGDWTALVRPSAKVPPGCRVDFAAGLSAEVGEVCVDGKRRVRFNVPDVISRLEGAGEIPLPPYIRRETPEAQDAERYQTVYASQLGAVAAPTAGLHLTERVFQRLDEAGVSHAFLTLHVGYGTFKPITVDALEAHKVDPEEFSFPDATADKLNEVRAAGGRVIAVGTTCARVLETQYGDGAYRPGAGAADLYIYPPYAFRGVDMLQTNFHLPRSSLLALVCAFAGCEKVMAAYRRAVSEGFHFYSYGDVMLIR